VEIKVARKQENPLMKRVRLEKNFLNIQKNNPAALAEILQKKFNINGNQELSHISIDNLEEIAILF